MASSALLKDPFEALRALSSAETWAQPQEKIREVRHRMEAPFYASEGYLAVEAMNHSGFSLETIGGFADVFWYGPSARCYVDDRSKGVPFLSSSQMMEARPTNYKNVSRKNTANLQSLVVHEDTILISRSGTVGNVALVPSAWEGWAVSEHAIQVIVHNSEDLGTVYCLLQSAPGQFLLTRSKSGSVVDTIYEADVGSLPVPKLPKRLRQKLTELVKEASALRVEANRLLDEAEKMVQVQLDLPDIEEFLDARNVPEEHNATIFTVPAKERVVGLGHFGRCRLDATAHDPSAVEVRQHILEHEAGVLLGELLDDVRNSNLRKRVYVEDPDYGVPLLGGKQLMQLRPGDLSYLSKALTKSLKREQVWEGWVVVSCGGTVGRALLVHRNYNGWVMSQHVMRLIHKEGEVYPGFVYAFIASPYGQIQITQFAYGSVQKELRDFHFRDLAIRLPLDRGRNIHDHVIHGFDLRAEAMESENQAFDLFMSAVKQGRQKTESEWGADY